MKSTLCLAATLLAAAEAASPSHHQMHQVRAAIIPKPATQPISGSLTSQGCFSSSGNLTKVDIAKSNSDQLQSYLSSGSCGKWCKDLGKNVAAVGPQDCYCGDAYPPKADSVNINDCDYGCQGIDTEGCGSLTGAISVYNTGIDVVVPYYQESSSKSTSKSASESTKSSGDSTSAQQTAVITETSPAQTSTASDDQGSKKGGPNTAAIAAGVVVGVVAAAAIIGGIIFYVRRKRNAEIEEEHRRNAAVNAFISGSKPPSTSGGVSITDARLDPVMAHRRLSDGSIADNHDYSRKILRVR